MTIYYSAAHRGFYDSELHSDLPVDAVALTADEHAVLLAGQAAGKQITPGQGGRPELTEPTPPAPVVPASVTRFQARAALMAAGRLDAVTAAVEASDDAFIKLAWAESVEFPRNSPTIAALATAIGLTDSDLDALFIAAAKISA